MSQKSSVPQAISFVSQVLKRHMAVFLPRVLGRSGVTLMARRWATWLEVSRE